MRRNGVTLVCGLAAVLLVSGPSLAAIVFSDDFESGNMDKWTLTVSNPLEISTAQNKVPDGGQHSAYMNNSFDRMHHNLIADNGGAELSGHLLFTSWIYDAPGTTATRIYNEIRGYSGGTGLPDGGTVASGALAQLLAIGKYNTVTAPEVYNAKKYQGRVAFGTTVNWFNLNGTGSPDRSAGWHRFDIEVMPGGTEVNFYVDQVLSRTITTSTASVTYDTLILGPGVGSGTGVVGDAWIDGLQVSIIPPPVEGVWVQSAGGEQSWAVADNWASSAIPGSIAGDTATFAASIGVESATVTLDGDRTLAGLAFTHDNGTGALTYTIAKGSDAWKLSMDNSASAATVTVTAGKHLISAPVTLLSDLNVETAGADNALECSGPIGGAGVLTKVNPGTLVLSGNNTYSATHVSGGTLQINRVGALPHGKALTIDAEATVVLSSGLSAAAAGATGAEVVQPLGAATPVPESGTLVLLAVGIALLVGCGRQTRR